ncbi:MAG: tetratricopeptide repeat protein [Parachlamydiaceae bacterium]
MIATVNPIRIIRNLLILFPCLLGWGCHRQDCGLDPDISYSPQRCLIEKLPCDFPKLTTRERSQDWGKEFYVGKSFASEMDFYRAITCFKKALFLLPRDTYERQFEIEYDIFLAYYVAGKYQEAVEAFEGSHLIGVPETFPALNDLRTLLYDAYIQDNRRERANVMLQAIAQNYTETANKLVLETEIRDGNLTAIPQAACNTLAEKGVCRMLSIYHAEAKSVGKAKMLNAILPGAGYYYVGQKKSALTSFLINALFIAASYQLFDRGYIPAAIITTSLECGWYFGGINGAGIEAQQYNRCLYERIGKETLVQERLFPILMIEYGF